MTFKSRQFDFLSWLEADAASKQDGATIVWPFGACEQHGPQLPLATDSLFAEKILKATLSRLPSDYPIWTLPPQSIGFSPEHASFPGTLTISANLFLEIVLEIGQQIASMGFRRLLLFNAHGGQIGLLQACARELRLKTSGMAILPCFLWSGVKPLSELIPYKEIEVGLHAGLAETSLMLAMCPELVGSDRPNDGEHLSSNSLATPPPGWSLEGAAPWSWLTKDLSETGVIGDSSGASKELGDSIESILVDHWVHLFTSLMESSWPPPNASKL